MSFGALAAGAAKYAAPTTRLSPDLSNCFLALSDSVTATVKAYWSAAAVAGESAVPGGACPHAVHASIANDNEHASSTLRCLDIVCIPSGPKTGAPPFARA